MGSLGTNTSLEGFDFKHPFDLEDFTKQAHVAVDFVTEYYKNVESLPVLSRVQPGFLTARLPVAAPLHPEPLETILADVKNLIIPGMTHWTSPNFFAYFPATISSAGFVGEMLCSSFNAVGFNWLASPSATELESSVMDWLAKLLKLPSSFMFSGTGGGVIEGTTSEAILCTVVAARDRALERVGEENIAKLGCLQNHIRSDVQMARMFEGFVKEDPWFENVVRRRFGLVCFRLCPPHQLDSGRVDELNRKLLEEVNSTGRLYITHTVVGGVYVLRFAVGSTFTEERHVTAAWELIKNKADELLTEIVE